MTIVDLGAHGTAEHLKTTECGLCGDKAGEDFTTFPVHLEQEHTFEDLNLDPELEDTSRQSSGDTDVVLADGGVPDPDQFAIPTIEELDAIRTANNLSQKELSRRAGMEPGRFHHILRNDVDPQTETMRAFLEVLQDAEPRGVDDVTRTGPKPAPSSLVETLETTDADDVLTDGGMEADTVLTCPAEDCDSSNVAVNVITDLQAPDEARDVTKYLCRACGERFNEDDAVYRERKIETLPRKDSIACSLIDADPEDLATDGGTAGPSSTETDHAGGGR